MKKKKQLGFLKWAFPLLFLVILLWGLNPAQAFTLGKTYDKNNYQEIQEMLIPPVLNWVKKGEFLITTGKLEYDYRCADYYLQESQKNEGKYDVSKDGVLVLKATGKKAEFAFGYPFPTIDPKDPKAGEKIMENNAAMRFRFSRGRENRSQCSLCFVTGYL